MNIALIGGMGAGKTTIGQYLVDNYSYELFGFADEVKRIAIMILKRSIDKAIDRTFLQDIGQLLKKSRNELTLNEYEKIWEWESNSNEFYEYRQNLLRKDIIHQPDFYYNVLFENKDFQKAYKKGKAVIHDMRFLYPEAVRWEADRSNKILLVNTPEEIRIKRLKSRDGKFDPKWLENSSEQDWPNILPDYIIDNFTENGGFPELSSKMFDFLK